MFFLEHFFIGRGPGLRLNYSDRNAVRENKFMRHEKRAMASGTGRVLLSSAWLLEIGTATAGVLLGMGILLRTALPTSQRPAAEVPEPSIRAQAARMDPESRVIQSALRHLRKHGRREPSLEI